MSFRSGLKHKIITKNISSVFRTQMYKLIVKMIDFSISN